MITFILLMALVYAQELSPAQQEGPFYPVTTLADTDHDLTLITGSDVLAMGDLLLLSGKVFDQDGQSLAGATVEIWQTDANGAYMHPNDPASPTRDMNFQFYGESVTKDDGSYAFKTILPGRYEPRPRHIHFKVKLAEVELLTSQFYFTGYEGAEAVSTPALLTVNLENIEDADYTTAYQGRKDIIVSLE